MNPSRTTERFWAKVKRGNPDECWEWTGRTRLGYGEMKVMKKDTRVHRISWELHYGMIPDGMCVCHKCDNPICVNPNHLFLGTNKDNLQDMWKKGRGHIPHYTGERNPKAKLTQNDVQKIRDAYASGKQVKEIAKEYPVTFNHLYKIIRKEFWIA